MAIVGDSQAHSLAVNLPDGIESTFDVTDGSLDGCSVYDDGRVRSVAAGFDNSFAMCAGWQQEWADAADGDADVVLVVLGAWDVFDLETGDGTRLTFGTPAWDAYVRTNLQTGPRRHRRCRRPGRACSRCRACARCRPRAPASRRCPSGATTRGSPTSTSCSGRSPRPTPATVTFVEGPDAWCADEAVATDVGMRWDGVHVYKPGAKLIYDTIAPTLLACDPFCPSNRPDRAGMKDRVRQSYPAVDTVVTAW